MRRLTWLFATAVAILAVHAGTARSVSPVETSTSIDVMQMQINADKNMPVMFIPDPV